MSRRALANGMLFLAAFIWGTAFVAQSLGMEHIGPFAFQAVRTLFGALALGIFILIRFLWEKKRGVQRKMEKEDWKTLLIGGSLTGAAQGLASMCQQVGILYSTVGNAGFLTSLYLVLVPILGIFIGRRARKKDWACVALSAVGVYLISASDGLSASKGDLLLIACAFLFSVQILLIDHFTGRLDPISFCGAEMLFSGILCSIPMLLFEDLSTASWKGALPPILYAGILSTAVAYTLQIAGQREADPAAAVLFMSLESVFSMLGGIVVLHQIPTLKALAGSVLIFAAVLASQLELSQARSLFSKNHSEKPY
ncbi:MAG: DMT family transporter [Lachnospiraceae bacterium]|nr:DMT family transporter [Lachnospiraceae bacterium]